MSKKVIIIGCGIIKGDNTNWNNKYIQWEGVRGPRTFNIIHKNFCKVSKLFLAL